MGRGMWAVMLLWAIARHAAAEETVESSVVYVPEAHLLSELQSQQMGLVGWLAEKHYDSLRGKAAQDLGVTVGSADVIADLLRELACPEAVSAERCTGLAIVPEKELDSYVAANTGRSLRVVRIAGMELTRHLYQLVVSASLIDPHAPSQRKTAAATYLDWDATAESVKTDYKQSLREVAEMLDYGLSVDYAPGQRGQPAAWESQPTLKQVKASGELRCVKNLIGDRVVRVGDARAWVGATTASGIQVTSLKWIRCR